MQLDVYDNPIPRARRAYPLVVVLQAELAKTGRDRIVAPLVPRTRLPTAVGRLTPLVEVAGDEHVVLVPSLTTVLAEDLRAHRGNVSRHRDALVAAIDYLFLGV